MNKKFKMKFLQVGEEGAKRPALYIYGDIYKTYNDWLNDSEGNTAKGIQKFLDENRDAEAIDVYINSMGGDVFEGTSMANQLRRFSGKVIVTIDGFACSVASVIAIAGDEVRMPKNATMMVHNIKTGIWGNAAEMRKMADDLDVLMEANKTIFLEHAGEKLDYDQLTEMMDAETWLTAEKCLEYGLADVVLDYTIDRDGKADQAGAQEVVQRADETITRLKQSKVLLDQMVTVVEKEKKEEPRNFMEIFARKGIKND